MELHLTVSNCRTCGSKRTVPNPKWQEFVATLTPELIASGTELPKVQQRIACPECKGLGSVLSDGFWELRRYLELASETEKHGVNDETN
jgi:hypothetical protein